MKDIENTIRKAALRRMTDMKMNSKILQRDMIKHFLFLLFLLPPAVKGFSQSLFSNDVYRPSVNSEQFNIGASIETALSKGHPSVAIPLFELQGKGYNLPISLMFYGGDVNCETEASSIGLGWSLMAGGCITATVKDQEDSFITTRNDAPWQFQGNYLDSILHSPAANSFFMGILNTDMMPDEIQYSIPGHQGTLELVENSQLQIDRKLYPDETYKLEKTSNGYIITADDGTKFFFEDVESKQTYGINSVTVSSAWFLTRIETVKGGTFLFYYADETMMDAHDEVELDWYGCHHTKRITSVVSDFGSVTFTSEGGRLDKSMYSMHGSPLSTPSERITKIELKDETGAVVRGYELKNKGYFTNDIQDPRGTTGWSNYRMRLDSIVEYDASGHKLPPYVFTYSYKFSRAKTCYNQYSNSNNLNSKRGSWTEVPPFQVLVNLFETGQPACWGPNPSIPNGQPEGISFVTDYHDVTVNDYFCLGSVKYPTGALDTFEYEPHDYTNIAGNDKQPGVNMGVAGKRLKRKVSDDGSGNTQANTVTEYIYRKHDSIYELAGGSSGMLTNPAFHNATRYTWGLVTDLDEGFVANRIRTDKPLNGYAGQPVYYREVEELVMNDNDSILRRNIHYFMDNCLEPPENYVYVDFSDASILDRFVTVPNFIYGKRTGYTGTLNGLNNENLAYLAYPLGEFCQQTQDGGLPRKEVTLDGDGRLILKREYIYTPTVNNTRYGYVYTKEVSNTPSMSVYNISRTGRHAHRNHVRAITETAYSYRDGHCDSTVTETTYSYDLGRQTNMCSIRQDESAIVSNFYPDMLDVGEGTGMSPEVQAVAALRQKNIIAKPIQTVRYNNGVIAEGHYSDYMVLPGGQVVPKACYDLSLDRLFINNPQVSNGAIVKSSGFYLQEEALAYDASLNPCHVGSRVSPDKVIVWGYGGRYPVAVIENYTGQQLNANSQLLSLLSQLEGYRKVGSQAAGSALKSLNMNIRNSLPDGVLVKTYTFDPYAGLTSEFDHSGVGTIYTYDGFGRLTAQYDDHFNLIENYTYHYGQ